MDRFKVAIVPFNHEDEEVIRTLREDWAFAEPDPEFAACFDDYEALAGEQDDVESSENDDEDGEDDEE